MLFVSILSTVFITLTLVFISHGKDVAKSMFFENFLEAPDKSKEMYSIKLKNANPTILRITVQDLPNCVADFGQSCICYKGQDHPFKSGVCPKGYYHLCYTWNSVRKSFTAPNVYQLASASLAISGKDSWMKSQKINIEENLKLGGYRGHWYDLQSIDMLYNQEKHEIGDNKEHILTLEPRSKRVDSNIKNFFFDFAIVHTTESCRFTLQLQNQEIVKEPAFEAENQLTWMPVLATKTMMVSTTTVKLDQSQKIERTEKEKVKSALAGFVSLNFSKFVLIPLVVILIEILETMICISMIYCAWKRFVCFSNFDVHRNTSSRNAAGKDDPITPTKIPPKPPEARNSKNGFKNTKDMIKQAKLFSNQKMEQKDETGEKSIEQKTAARDFDNFGNLTSEETNRTQDAKTKKKVLPPPTLPLQLPSKEPLKKIQEPQLQESGAAVGLDMSNRIKKVSTTTEAKDLLKTKPEIVQSVSKMAPTVTSSNQTGVSQTGETITPLTKTEIESENNARCPKPREQVPLITETPEFTDLVNLEDSTQTFSPPKTTSVNAEVLQTTLRQTEKEPNFWRCFFNRDTESRPMFWIFFRFMCGFYFVAFIINILIVTLLFMIPNRKK